MATGEQPSPLKSKKISSSSVRSRNDSDSQWLLLPNNLELGARAKPSKKQRNKEKHRQFQKENLSSSEVADALSCKADSFRNYPQVKCNTATWLKDQFMNDEKSKLKVYDSEEVFSDSDLQSHQQNVNLPSNQTFSDLDHQEHQPISRCVVENDNIKSVKDELKKRETAIVCEILSHIQEFISEAESSWQKLDLSDEPIIKDAFLKLKNAVKDVEGDRENKRMCHHLTSENGFSNGVSPSSSTSRVSNSKENIGNRDSVGNKVLCSDDEQEKCNHLHKPKVSDETAESLSSDDCSIVDVGERVAAVEWERRKLKNKLVELQEEKKIKDELLRELCFLKDAANTASSSSQYLKATDRKKKKLYKYQSSQQSKLANGVCSEDNQNITQEPGDMVVSQIGPRHSRSSASVKRDNVRKEQNSAFPARRHYEAEGRANEDADIPAASAPISSPVLDNPEIHDKIRKLKVAQQHVKVIKDIVVSILESRKSGSSIPLEQLRLLAPMHHSDQYFSDESTEESELDKDLHSGALESTTNAKEICSADLKTVFLDGDSHKAEDIKQVPGNLETVGKKGDLAKLQSQFQQLMQIFPTADRNNDDPVRSSGEGAYTQKKNSNNIVPENVQKIQSIRTLPHQDNLQLTRQNIVSVESQSQISNSYLHNRDCNTVKKDNINNLSGKMGKLSIQNSMNSSYPDVLTGSNNNVDTISTLSYELNQNHSLPNEVERKTILDILKRDKKKQKHYDRNQDSKMCCNSSVDSEPLEGSNSALVVDTTTTAAWGGSSTQDIEDENEEHAESLEQDDEEENASVFEKGSLRGQGSSSQYSGQFSNMHHYTGSPTNIPGKRQRNLHHPLYNRNQNQPIMQSEYQQHSAQAMKSSHRRLSAHSASGGISREMLNTSHPADTTEYNNQHPSPKFIQQLKNHVDQINALCQNQIFHDRSQQSVSCPQSYHLPNTCIPFQHGPEMAVPCNQQMLLCLSQCYHALYMQQLEIQHLQRCMWHNLDTENVQHPNSLNTRTTQEDPSFRPHCAPSWSNPFPSSHFPPDISSMSSVYHHMPMKPYPTHNAGVYGSVHSTQPARAVIHPTSQNNMPSQETLNNQVPPRTRANNFWDNFRSYSRQNLLSTSNNNKRNENASSLITPQVRQVYPLVANDSPNFSPDTSNAFCNTASFSESNRLATNPDVLDATNFPKKAKTNTPTSATTGASSFQKKDVPTGVVYAGFQNVRSNKCHRINTEPSVMQPVSNPASINLIQLQPIQETSKVGICSTVCPSSFHQVMPETPVSSATSEIPISHTVDNPSDYLSGIFHEAQSLKSDVLRQKALKIIRDLAMSESNESDDITQVKIQNDHLLPAIKPESVHSSVFNQSCTKQPIEGAIASEFHEPGHTHFLPDNSTGNLQSVMTTAILPLNKHSTPRTVSTGAVRKKPKILSTCFTDPISNGPVSHDSPGSIANCSDVNTSSLTINKAVDDVPGLVTEKVLADLVSMLPSLKRRLLRDGCSQTFWTFINDCLIESLRKHLFYCNISLSRKSLIHLRQTVYLFISLFSGITLPDFDTDFVKYVEEFIYENVTCFVASGQFAPVPPSLDEETCSLGIEDKTEELGLKIPLEQNDQMKELSIKMPSEESDDFSPHYRASQQNLLQSLCSFEHFIPEPANEPDYVSAAAEDVGCGCNPEAEIEPEVEIGTEADLAEADQSPGQQGTIGENLTTTESWSADQEIVLNKNMTNTGGINLNIDDSREAENLSEAASGSQVFSDACLDHEAILDDIPIKLCPSEEELQHHPKEEQTIPLPSEDNSYNEYLYENNGDDGSSTLR